MLSSNFALAHRLEMAEAAVARLTADAFVRAGFEQDVIAEPIAGGVALYAGAGSPLTRALGIGMNGPVTLQEMNRLEQFFHSRGSACLIDLCAMADSAVTGAVIDRKYRIVEFNNVMVRRLAAGETFQSSSREAKIRLTRPDEGELWARTILQGFMGDEPITAGMLKMMGPTCHIGSCYLAFSEERVAAGCAMAIHERVADFFGDSTLITKRGRGIQQALIQQRLVDAVQQGCDLAMASVLPGSGSHRNYERCGFQLAYMRVNVALDYQG